jgi:biotin carboxylase
VTIVVLDRTTGPLPPYADWLRGGDIVLATPRPRPDTRGYADVWTVPDYATSAAVDLRVLALAGVTAVVATHPADLVRAAGLRGRLGLPGQDRATAEAVADPVVTHDVLRRAGVPVVDRGAVTQPSDLYWFAHRWGYPLRVRARKETGWPTLAVLRADADVRELTEGGLVPDALSVPALMAEPDLPGARHVVTGAAPPAAASVVAAALAALRLEDAGWCRTEVVHTGGEWLVDTVGADPRALVRAQAGPEVTS